MIRSHRGRKISVIRWLACVALTLAAHGQAAGQQPVAINFDLSALNYSSDPSYVPISTLSSSGSNVFVSFLGASGFSATIGSGSLTKSGTTWTYATGSGTTSTTSVLSPSFPVSFLQSNQLSLIQASGRVYFSYGADSYGNGSPPGTPLPSGGTRYSFVEINYNDGNGLDATNIDQFGGSLKITARNAASQSTATVGNSLSTQEMMTTLTQVTGGTGSSVVVMSGTQVSSVSGVQFAGTSPVYGNLQSYLNAVWTGTGSSALKQPTLTNIIDSAYPGGLGAAGWTSSASPASGTASYNVSANTNYNVGYYFQPTIVPSGSYASVTFSGSVTITSATSNNPILKTYDGLTISIASSSTAGTAGAGMNSYLNSGGPTDDTMITLTGTGWTSFNQDFFLPNNNSSAAPNSDLINTGSFTSQNVSYGQVVQKVLGDFQEGVTAGMYGNTMSGTYTYYQNNRPTGVTGTAAAYGELSSALWFQNPSLAYSNTDATSMNLYAKQIFPNTFVSSPSGTAMFGGVYGAPFDDRYNSNLSEPWLKNTIPIPTDGGSLTFQFYEAAPVPEPSSIILVISGSALGGFAWRRRRKPAGRG